MAITAIQRWGNSQGIRLPKQLLDALHWELNEKITITPQDNRLILEPAHPKKHQTIAELFNGFDGQYNCSEIDWGQPVGKEIW